MCFYIIVLLLVSATDPGIFYVDGLYIKNANYWLSVCENFFAHSSRDSSDGNWAIEIKMGDFIDYFRPDPNLEDASLGVYDVSVCDMLTVRKLINKNYHILLTLVDNVDSQ